ncbi:unnamed protein product [Enterobius vermicularis]|uniref:DUF4469 domain-containing protein n=1 Tax=Enterobius vermicularis TaxID=51028 RepID=A0A0N4V503_ENTVE|nr:unnamed protein product [Enterobius vermicularis]
MLKLNTITELIASPCVNGNMGYFERPERVVCYHIINISEEILVNDNKYKKKLPLELLPGSVLIILMKPASPSTNFSAVIELGKFEAQKENNNELVEKSESEGCEGTTGTTSCRKHPHKGTALSSTTPQNSTENAGITMISSINETENKHNETSRLSATNEGEGQHRGHEASGKQVKGKGYTKNGSQEKGKEKIFLLVYKDGYHSTDYPAPEDFHGVDFFTIQGSVKIVEVLVDYFFEAGSRHTVRPIFSLQCNLS